jgi:hypothetical protein
VLKKKKMIGFLKLEEDKHTHRLKTLTNTLQMFPIPSFHRSTHPATEAEEDAEFVMGQHHGPVAVDDTKTRLVDSLGTPHGRELFRAIASIRCIWEVIVECLRGLKGVTTRNGATDFTIRLDLDTQIRPLKFSVHLRYDTETGEHVTFINCISSSPAACTAFRRLVAILRTEFSTSFSQTDLRHCSVSTLCDYATRGVLPTTPLLEQRVDRCHADRCAYDSLRQLPLPEWALEHCLSLLVPSHGTGVQVAFLRQYFAQAKVKSAEDKA